MDLGLEGKWALVCAASKGLGKGCALALAREGANVVITALRDDAGDLRGYAKVTRDVTEKKLAEENARRLIEESAARSAATRHPPARGASTG